jgi:hypothetical protein
MRYFSANLPVENVIVVDGSLIISPTKIRKELPGMASRILNNRMAITTAICSLLESDTAQTRVSIRGFLWNTRVMVHSYDSVGQKKRFSNLTPAEERMVVGLRQFLYALYKRGSTGSDSVTLYVMHNLNSGKSLAFASTYTLVDQTTDYALSLST